MYKCFINLVICPKEKLHNAPRLIFDMDFVLNFSMCSSDETCFKRLTS